MNMNKGKRIALVCVIAAAGVGIAIWWLWSSPQGSTDTRIFVSGNIEATEVDLSFRLGGQIDYLPIEEGDSITEGQVVARLDTRTLIAQKKAAEAEQAAAQATLDELVTGSRVEDIEAARAVLKASERRLENARADYERYVPLYKQGAISASAYDARETAYRVALEEHKKAREDLTQLEVGPREERIRAARHRLDRAKWELEKIELDLTYSVLQSPINGVVLVKSNENGEVVLPGATVATVAGINEVWLKGYVGEKYLGKIKLGQTAEITTDTFPNKKYQGRLTLISSRAEFTPKNVQTPEERIKQVYRVKVTIPNVHQELKIGMPAEGHILVDSEPHKPTADNSRVGSGPGARP
ncbi:MAG: efflux RND transporter periplasmic adaptor subunit [Thermodesulfobacteriota bacterium]